MNGVKTDGTFIWNLLKCAHEPPNRGESQIVVISRSIEQHKMLATDGDLVRVLIVGDNLEGVVDMNEEILFDKDKDDHLRWKFELKKTFSLQW